MKIFNVITYDINSDKFEPYNIFPHFERKYNELVEKSKSKNGSYYPVPKTYEEFKEFIIREGKYHYWARCEYEVILKDWPCKRTEKKIDVWWQIELNLDFITKIFMEWLT